MSVENIMWGMLFLMMALSVFLLVDIVVKLSTRNFEKLFDRMLVIMTMMGSFGTLYGVLLLKQDADLKDRPYVYTETKILEHTGNTFVSETAMKNSGNTPAYKIFVVPSVTINGEEVPAPAKESKVFSLYPNSVQYHHFSVDYHPGDDIEYSISIDYENYAGKKFHYGELNKFWDMGELGYDWKTMSSD
jgi:hypothetical protein